jgi:hypothetical protein
MQDASETASFSFAFTQEWIWWACKMHWSLIWKKVNSFWIKKILIFCSINYEFCLLLVCCLSPFIWSLHVVCLFFLEEFNISELQNSKPQVLKFLVVFVCKSAEMWVRILVRLHTSTHCYHPLLLPTATMAWCRNWKASWLWGIPGTLWLFVLISHFFQMFLVPHWPKMSFDLNF